MADELANLKQQMADMQHQLAALTGRTAPPARQVFEMTFTGPARRRAAAVTALEEAGYTVTAVDPLHDGNTDGWVEAHIEWTRTGPIHDTFQADHLTKAGAAADAYGYTLAMSGIAGAGTHTR